MVVAIALLMAYNTALADNDMMVRCIAFYNLENLFDTIHDEGKNDYEYLPDGGMKWTSMKYQHKLHNMAYAIAQLGTEFFRTVRNKNRSYLIHNDTLLS